MTCSIVEFRPLARKSLVGFATVRFASGLVLHGVGIHRAGTRIWASPPGAPRIRDGVVIAGENGKPAYVPMVSFVSHGVRSSWSRQIIKAMQDARPELFADAPMTNNVRKGIDRT